MIKNNRVIGIIGIRSDMANWNADFTGRPKTDTRGNIFGSDKALKYSLRKYWNDIGEKVLFFKSYTLQKGKLQPKELNERYEELFGGKVNDKTDSEEIIKKLFSTIDVMNFGATFAVSKQNISITGTVQIGQGMNKYNESEVMTHGILSPFRNSNKDEADSSTLGRQVISEEVHYFYPFTVNPQNYKNYTELIDDFEGYTKHAYELFKEGSLVGATALNTCSKAGCENEFALFIEFKEGSKSYLPSLDKYVSFEKGEEKNLIDITKIKNILEEGNILDEVDGIEIYYNPYTTDLKNDIETAKVYNIFTREIVK
ncbi:type I CRISPR-associated protein Cas7 [Gottschalkia purinilytica]|nr:type I CRISPR-associated protein Cas7 [Gottschalkia purinilytica]